MLDGQGPYYEEALHNEAMEPEPPKLKYLGRRFEDLVVDELAQARAGFRDMASAHEGYAVLLEEVDELWDEVKVNQKRRDPVKMLRELIQVAAMAQRMAEDIIFDDKIRE